MALIIFVIVVIGGSICFYYLSLPKPPSHDNNSSLVEKLIESDNDDFLFFEKSGDIERITIQPLYFKDYSAIIELENDVTVARTAGGFIVLGTHNGELITVNATSTKITVDSPRSFLRWSALVNLNNETVTVAFANGTSTRYSIKHYNDNEAKRVKVFSKETRYPQYYYWGPRKIVIQTDSIVSPIIVYSHERYTTVNFNGVSVLITVIADALFNTFSKFMVKKGGDFIPVWTNFYRRFNGSSSPPLIFSRRGPNSTTIKIDTASGSTVFERRNSDELALRFTNGTENNKPSRKMIIRPSLLQFEEQNEYGTLYADLDERSIEIRAANGPTVYGNLFGPQFCQIFDGNSSYRITFDDVKLGKFNATTDFGSLYADSKSVTVMNAGGEFRLKDLINLTVISNETGKLIADLQSNNFNMTKGGKLSKAVDVEIWSGAIGNVSLSNKIISNIITKSGNLTNIGGTWLVDYPSGRTRFDAIKKRVHVAYGRVSATVGDNYYALVKVERDTRFVMFIPFEGATYADYQILNSDVGRFEVEGNKSEITGKLATISIKPISIYLYV